MISLEAGAVALMLLEGLKFLLRRLILKDPEFEFPAIYYTLMIPFLTALSGVGLGYLGWAEVIPFDLSATVQWAVAILFELLFYHMGVQPFKDFARGE